MSHALRFCGFFLFSALTSSSGLSALPAPPPNPQFIGADEIETGTKAIGYTVFSSNEGLKSFEVKILGVMKNVVAPGQDLIIAELPEKRFNKTGVVSGMSGSPVYVGDRLLGAIGYNVGPQFSEHAIAGITPIKDMLSKAGIINTQLIKPVALPLVADGVHAATLEIFKDRLQKHGLEAMSFATKSLGKKNMAPPSLFAGGPISAIVVDGDLTISAIGTVTYVNGKEFAAFGHPFTQGGVSQLAAAGAEIVTTIFSPINSQKLGQATQILGSVVSDNSTGIRGTLGDGPSMIPVSLRIDGRSFSFRIAPVGKDVAMYTGMILANTLLGRPDRELGGSVEAHMKVKLDGQELSLVHHAAGNDVAVEADLAKAFTDELTYLLDQPFAPARVRSLTCEVKTTPLVRRNALIDVYVNSTARQGEEAKFRLRLQPWQSPHFEVYHSFKIPKGVPAGDYQVLVADRANAIRIESDAGILSHPRTFDLIVKQIKGLPSESDLCFYLQGIDPAPELSGQSLTRLPFKLQALTSNFVVDATEQHAKSAFKLGCKRFDSFVSGNVTGSLKLLSSKER